ncbi:hypothetical protein, variant 2 [Capsaspora owczarzaki ATCC 30864]|uniref:Uncharacterized protein n=1 Tax=Capsaspora owczarzaki (strain ATCC 30864) TaxID=595528 RepID=A0A0D2WTM7_CAPO3|nr:hypothetical protein, variant 2 [Capsaspora owczarzaki ATCC 30864]
MRKKQLKGGRVPKVHIHRTNAVRLLCQAANTLASHFNAAGFCPPHFAFGRCVNCEMDVFASFRPLGVSCSRPNAPTLAALLPKTAILTSSKLIVGQEAVARRQTQENYSPIFRVILDPLSPSELADAAAVLEKSNDLLQALQEQVTSQLKREKDASEARIKAYIDKEHADYTKLEKSAHDVKFTLFHKLAGLRQQAIATAISDAMGDALNDVLGNDSPVFSPLSASKSPKSGLAQVASQLQHLAAMEAVPAVVVTTEQGPQRFSPAGYNGHRGSPSSVLGASARENSDIPTLSTVGVRIPPASFTASPRFPVVPPSSVAGSFIPPSSVSNASRFSSALSEGLKSVASDSDAPPTTSTDSPKLLNRIVWNKGASSNSGSQHSNLSKSVPASRVNFGGRRDSDSSDALFDMDGFESSSSTDRHRRNDTFDEEDEEDALEEGASTGRQLAAPAADGMALYASSVPMGIPARAAASFVADDDSMAYRSRGLQVPGSPETDRMQDLAASIRELSRLSVNDSTATFGDLPRRKMSTIL